MQRREFLTGLAAAALMWPACARAQASVPVLGFINGRPESPHFMEAFRQGLRESGYVEGSQVSIEYRGSEGRNELLPGMAAELINRQVSLIVAAGGPAAAIAAKAETVSIPIVFIGGSDPIGSGLVASINRPGGNVTGILNIASALTAKRLELLREFVPAAQTVAVLHNPNYPEVQTQLNEIVDAVGKIGLKPHFASAARESDFDSALASAAKHGAAILFVANDPFFASQRVKLAELVARHGIPAAYAQREYAEAGGLMSYGANFADLYRQGGIYAGRILKGEKPEDLPVVQPSRLELVINLKTAKALNVDIPVKLLALADEVIE